MGTEERDATGKTTPGAIEGLTDGHCYLVETNQGNFALVRLIQKRGRLALIQYVYQPDGSRMFDIPKGKLIDVPPPAQANQAAATGEGRRECDRPAKPA